MQDHRDDRRESDDVGVSLEIALPDPHQGLEQAERHQHVDSALVLEEHIDEHLLPGGVDGEQQVCVAGAKELIHEAANGHPDAAWLALLADVIGKKAEPSVLDAWLAWVAE